MTTQQKDVRDTAASFNLRNKWDCNQAIELALEVLTDANCHPERRLLEAAPDMLAALQLLVAMDSCNYDRGVQEDGYMQARRAISRATGEGAE